LGFVAIKTVKINIIENLFLHTVYTVKSDSVLPALLQGRREDFKAFSGLVSYKLDYTPRFTSLPSGVPIASK
jgi:hypothetical protein